MVSSYLVAAFLQQIRQIAVTNICIHIFREKKNTSKTINTLPQRTGVQQNGLSRHHGNSIEGLLKPIKHYDFMVSRGSREDYNGFNSNRTDSVQVKLPETSTIYIQKLT